MNRGIIFRLIIFFAMITLLVALIGWIAHTSWQRTSDLHEQLSKKQDESFYIANHIQQTILGLNNDMFRYAANRDEADWISFSNNSRAFGLWLRQQEPLLSSQAERKVVAGINAFFTNYLNAAAAINVKLYGPRQTSTRVVEFTDLEKQSKSILDLGLKLSNAHQDVINSLQLQGIHSVNFLRVELLGLLLILVVAGVWVVVIVYRELLTPLRVQLIESRQLAEQHEKLASLGMLAAGVAHEIRNPLTAIKAWLYLQQKHLKPGTPEFADTELISGEISRLERIVRDFLQFARPSDPQWAVVSAGQPLYEVQTLLLPGLEKSGIKLVVAEAVPAQIRIDPQQIKQVLINLIQNAADSIGRDGTITLRAVTDEKRIADEQLDVVILQVSDTGKGIPEDVQKRLFDPFFTTKDTGTGLGLPIAARIIEKHGGALQYQNLGEQGATFGIILPLYKP
ncbi:MAG TPA: ATP-binding protein [Candidatus Acidoferrales bacterium]|jgi:signal transduction histidine kinase|nr:ATP-binding protein [Candidatus Acidoferrales bacterium]